jgi:hypothetical protein
MTSPHEQSLIRQAAWAALPSCNVLAREDPVVFCELVLRDETTGKCIDVAPFQEEWHEALLAHDRVVIMTSPESGKSQQLTIGWFLWLLGRDPKHFRGCFASKTQPNAAKFSSIAMRYIAQSKHFAQVFPGVRPGPLWSTDRFTVARDGAGTMDYAKDPSAQTCGAEGSILGSRLSFAPCDDMIDAENTRTEARSDKVVFWLLNQLDDRMMKRRGDGSGSDGKIVFVCNAWEEYDAGHKLAREHGWHLCKTPIALPETATPAHPNGLTRWPKVWPQERIDAHPPATVARKVHCIARAPGERRFNAAWIERCKELGKGLTLVRALDRMPPGCFTVCGVDLASRKHKQSDRTVFFVAMAGPAEAFGLAGRVDHNELLIRPLWIHAARMTSPEIKGMVATLHERYGCQFLVEDAAAQIYIVQDLHLARPDIRVEPFTTTATKWHPDYGIEGIAAELSMGEWVLPSFVGSSGLLECEDELQAWIGELLAYDPAAHTGDRTMASWFMREGVRRFFTYDVRTAMSEDEEAAVMRELAGQTGPLPIPTERPKVQSMTEDEARKLQAKSLWDGLERAQVGEDKGDGTYFNW